MWVCVGVLGWGSGDWGEVQREIFEEVGRVGLEVFCFCGFFFVLFWFFLVFLPFLGALSRHMEVPRLGV